MGYNVQSPLSRFIDFALFFAYHYCNTGFLHPVYLPSAEYFILLIGGFSQVSRKFIDTLLPVLLNEVIHLYTGKLIDAYKHRFTAFPGGGIVSYEIPGYLVKAFFSGDNMIITLEFLFQPLLYVDIAVSQLFNFE